MNKNAKEDYLKYRVKIKMLACWDTVGSLGIPDLIPWLQISKIWNKRYEFFDATLSPIVENAFHAVAIDEKHKCFPSTPMEKTTKIATKWLRRFSLLANMVVLAAEQRNIKGYRIILWNG